MVTDRHLLLTFQLPKPSPAFDLREARFLGRAARVNTVPMSGPAAQPTATATAGLRAHWETLMPLSHDANHITLKPAKSHAQGSSRRCSWQGLNSEPQSPQRWPVSIHRVLAKHTGFHIFTTAVPPAPGPAQTDQQPSVLARSSSTRDKAFRRSSPLPSSAKHLPTTAIATQDSERCQQLLCLRGIFYCEEVGCTLGQSAQHTLQVQGQQNRKFNIPL